MRVEFRVFYGYDEILGFCAFFGFREILGFFEFRGFRGSCQFVGFCEFLGFITSSELTELDYVSSVLIYVVTFLKKFRLI